MNASTAALEHVMACTDWGLFKLQKEALVAASRNNDLLTGLLHWIDAIQDAAEAAGMIP
jgi:hypothetical protein